MDEKIEDKVLHFFKVAVSKDINEQSIINELCHYEDDAFYLLSEFFEKFKIERGHLKLDKYFNNHPSFWDIIKFKKRILETKPPIQVSHMINVAKKGIWYDPD